MEGKAFFAVAVIAVAALFAVHYNALVHSTDYEEFLSDLKTVSAVQPYGEASQLFIEHKGVLLDVEGESVQAYEFTSARSANEFADSVSADGTEIGASMVTWISEPHFYKSGKLIVIYVGENAEVQGILTAFLGPQFAGGAADL